MCLDIIPTLETQNHNFFGCEWFGFETSTKDTNTKLYIKKIDFKFVLALDMIEILEFVRKVIHI